MEQRSDADESVTVPADGSADSRRWWALAAVAVVVLAVGDWAGRVVTIASLLDAVEATEAVMISEGDELSAVVYRDGFVRNPADETQRKNNLRMIRQVYSQLEADLVVAADAADELRLLPWWGELAEARDDYLEHVAAWQERFASVREDPQNYSASFPAISSSFRLACDALHDAVPRLDFRGSGERVARICED